MNKPNYPKTPLSLALAGLCFAGFNDAHADRYDEWGFWAGSGAPNGDNGGPGDDLGGDPLIQDGPLGDDIFDQFEGQANLALMGGDNGNGGDEAPNPFAVEDPPTGTWDTYAANSYGGCVDCGGPPGSFGAVASGTLALTPSTGISQGSPSTDGIINLNLIDMEDPAVTAGFNAVGDDFDLETCEVCIQVGDADEGTQFLPFGTEGIEGRINSGTDPGDVEDMVDFFADGSVETPGGLIGEGGVFVAGQRTPSADLQTMNVNDVSANYQGSSFGHGHSVSIDINFGGQGSWDGSFTDGVVANHTGPHDFTAMGGFQGAHGVSTGVGGDATSGDVNFTLFGPEAAKLGGKFDVQGPGDFGMTVVKDLFSAEKNGDVIPGAFREDN